MKVCLDAGHGGDDPGAVGHLPTYTEEKDVTLAIAALLEGELESLGHWGVMTRRKDRNVSLNARATFANRLEADLFVSVHANAAQSSSVEGFEVYCFPASAGGSEAAQSVLDRLVAAFPGHRNRGAKEANFAVLRLTDMPAILVETEFLTNPAQLQFLSDPNNQQQIARAIAAGINDLEA